MSEQRQATYEGWAIVDVLGHQRYVGYVTTEAYGQAVLFRIDVPALDARERETKRPEWVGDKYVPAGTTVQEGAVAGYTKLVGSGSIYTITPCTKDAALQAVEEMQRRPLMTVTLPPNADVLALHGEIDSAWSACPTCHSTTFPCECDSADEPDDDDVDASDDQPDDPAA